MNHEWGVTIIIIIIVMEAPQKIVASLPSLDNVVEPTSRGKDGCDCDTLRRRDFSGQKEDGFVSLIMFI